MNRLTGVLAVAALLAAGCASAAGTTTTQARTGAHFSLHLVPPDAKGAAAQPVLRLAPALPNQAPVISTQRPIHHGTPHSPPTPAPPADTERPAAPGQGAAGTCPPKAGSGLPCVVP